MPIIVYYNFERLTGLEIFDLFEIGDVQALLENPILVDSRLTDRGGIHISVNAPRPKFIVILFRSEGQLFMLGLRVISFG